MPLTEELDADTPTLDWLKADLLAWALNHGLDVNDSMTKPDILAAIQAA